MIDSFSFSAFSSAAQCLRKFEHQYVLKTPQEGPESGDLCFGSALHSALNSVLTGEDGPATFDLYWGMYKDKPLEYGRYGWEQLHGLGRRFVARFTSVYAPRMQLLFAEKRLHGEAFGIKFDGQPDALVLLDGKRTLLDFKTSGSNYSEDKGIVSMQLNLYAHLCMQNGLGPIEQLAYFVFNKGTGCIQHPLVWQFSQEKINLTMVNLSSYIRTWTDGASLRQAPQNFNACLDYNRRCPFFNKCHGTEEK